MTQFDADGARTALILRVNEQREQVIRFVRQLDGARVQPGALPEGIVEALATADAALAQLSTSLSGEELSVYDMDLLERRLGGVEDHIREVEQELWSAAVRTRGL